MHMQCCQIQGCTMKQSETVTAAPMIHTRDLEQPDKALQLDMLPALCYMLYAAHSPCRGVWQCHASWPSMSAIHSMSIPDRRQSANTTLAIFPSPCQSAASPTIKQATHTLYSKAFTLIWHLYLSAPVPDHSRPSDPQKPTPPAHFPYASYPTLPAPGLCLRSSPPYSGAGRPKTASAATTISHLPLLALAMSPRTPLHHCHRYSPTVHSPF